MSHHFDAMQKVMEDAEEKVLTAGMSGGDVHAQVDSGTVMMATMSWAVREIKESNAKLAKELCNGGVDSTVRDRIKKGGPAAGLGAAVVAILAYVREWF